MPKYGQKYWAWHYERKEVGELIWWDSSSDHRIRREGNVHPTKEAAEAWGAAQGEKE
jgi:hypothetical protein